MALTGTLLVGAIGAGDTIIRVLSSTGFVRGQQAQIDAEEIGLLAQNPESPEQWTVARGQGGTRAVPHATRAAVVSGPAEDWPITQPVSVYSYGAVAEIQPNPGLHELNTGAASAMTLADPALVQDGVQLVIVAKTAHAYTVTNAAGFQGADVGTEATFGGAIGDNFVIEAQNGRWVVLSVANVAIST